MMLRDQECTLNREVVGFERRLAAIEVGPIFFGFSETAHVSVKDKGLTTALPVALSMVEFNEQGVRPEDCPIRLTDPACTCRRKRNVDVGVRGMPAFADSVKCYGRLVNLGNGTSIDSCYTNSY